MSRLTVCISASSLIASILSCSSPPAGNDDPPPEEGPSISVSPASLSFTGTPGGSAPATQTVQIINGGTGSLTGLSLGPVAYQSGTAWITTTNLNLPIAPTTLTVGVSVAGLAPGTYTATIPVKSGASGVRNSPQAVTVTLTVGTPTASTFAQVSASGVHTCGRTPNNVTYCWGSGYGVGIGIPTTFNQPPTPVLTSETFVELSSGGSWTCGRTAANVAWCWGKNDEGQLGDGTTINRSTPVLVGGGLAFVEIKGGYNHACGRTIANAVYCWGENGSGQLGDGTRTDRELPVLVSGNLPLVQISPGFLRTCGLTGSGVAYCWGASTETLADGIHVDRSTPVPVSGNLQFATLSVGGFKCGITTGNQAYCWSSTTNNVPTAVPGGISFVEIGVSDLSVCARTAVGAAYCWGDNAVGQVGNGTSGPTVATPTLVSGGHLFTSLSVGGGHVCARKATGSVWCWGDGLAGQLGVQVGPFSSVPVRVGGDAVPEPPTPAIGLSTNSVSFTGSIGGAAPATQTVQITNVGSGTLSGLGVGPVAYQNGSGWLTTATLSSTTAPANLTLGLSLGSLVAGTYRASIPLTSTASGIANSPQTIAITLTLTGSTGSPIVEVAAGGSQTCGRTTAGAVTCSGSNGFGEVGNGTTTPVLAPVAVVGGQLFSEISTGNLHSCGRTSSGTVYCWGENSQGQLGDGTTTSRSVPVQVQGGLSFTQIAAGGRHTCGRTAANTVYCWGSNSAGQLGDGTTTNRAVPTLVTGGQAFVEVRGGGVHTCGRTGSNAVYCWGDNNVGAVGDGSQGGNRLTPTLVAGGLSFAAISLKTAHSCARTTANVVYCWGDNLFGQLGDGTTTRRLVPTAVSGGQAFVDVAAGEQHSCARNAAGTVYCWGTNSFGQLGDGTLTSHLVPAPVSGGQTFIGLASGNNHTCGWTASAVYCWGQNSGRIGDGGTIDRLVPTRNGGP